MAASRSACSKAIIHAVVAAVVAGRVQAQPGGSTLEIAEIAGVPTSITDGDTFRLGDVRVRLWGMDAPELSTRFGPAARQRLTELIAGRAVRCGPEVGRSHRRTVRECVNWRGVDLSQEMVREGWAIDWPRYSGGAYAADEAAARRAKAGVFAYGVQSRR
jgi:endonuclease YncB( thermonuclease family)